MQSTSRSHPPKVNKYHPISSVKYALEGILFSLKREPNIVFQLVLGSAFTAFGVANQQWASALANIILMAVVIAFELINSAMETLCDLLHPEIHPQVKIIKDSAAGAVLIVAFAWLVVILYQLLAVFGQVKLF